MSLRPQPIDPKSVAFIEAAIREAMAPYALRSIRIVPKDNHAGEPSIFIDIDHDLSRTPVDSSKVQALHLRIWRHLLDAGEDRFPYIFHHWHEDQKGSWDNWATT